MDTALLTDKFAKMGGRVRFGPRISQQENRWLVDGDRMLRVDIRTDRRGEYFEIRVDDSLVDLEVVDLKPKDRHLLLLARRIDQRQKDKFLCGHDERHWFVAAVPNARGVSNIRTAMEALKPEEVRDAQDKKQVKFRDRGRRSTAAYVRQGEWFFLPEPDLQVPDAYILHDEPLQRSGGKPHMAEHLYRKGGVTVHVCSMYPNGLEDDYYREVLDRNHRARYWHWQTRQRDATVYVKGRIRHSDHRTVSLTCWHRVAMNTETQARAMRNVAFLD